MKTKITMTLEDYKNITAKIDNLSLLHKKLTTDFVELLILFYKNNIDVSDVLTKIGWSSEKAKRLSEWVINQVENEKKED